MLWEIFYALDAIFTPLLILLGIGSDSHALAGTGWYFGATVADFLTWLIDFGGRVMEFLG